MSGVIEENNDKMIGHVTAKVKRKHLPIASPKRQRLTKMLRKVKNHMQNILISNGVPYFRLCSFLFQN